MVEGDVRWWSARERDRQSMSWDVLGNSVQAGYSLSADSEMATKETAYGTICGRHTTQVDLNSTGDPPGKKDEMGGAGDLEAGGIHHGSWSGGVGEVGKSSEQLVES